MVFSTNCNCGISNLLDFLFGDGLLSLLCLFDDFGHLCFDCVDDVLNVLNMCVHDMLCLLLRSSDKHLNGLFSERNVRVCNDLLQRTLLNFVLRKILEVSATSSTTGRTGVSTICSTFHDFLDNIQLWDLNCLCRVMRLRDLHDLHNKDINHVAKRVQLWNLYGLLNNLSNRRLLSIVRAVIASSKAIRAISDASSEF